MKHSMLVKNKKILIAAYCIVAWVVAANIGDQYRATALVAPVARESLTPDLLSNSVGGEFSRVMMYSNFFGDPNSTQDAISVMRSRRFAAHFLTEIRSKIKSNAELDGNLFSDVTGLDPNNRPSIPGSFKYADFEIFSVNYGVKDFIARLDVAENRKNETVEIAFKSRNPQEAKFIVDNIIVKVNEFMLNNEHKIIQNEISSIEEKYKNISSTEVKDTLVSLKILKEKEAALLGLNGDFVFFVVDPAALPETALYYDRILVFLIFGAVPLVLRLLVDGSRKGDQLGWQEYK